MKRDESRAYTNNTSDYMLNQLLNQKLHLIADKLRDRVKIDFHVYAPHLSYLPFKLEIRSLLFSLMYLTIY